MSAAPPSRVVPPAATQNQDCPATNLPDDVLIEIFEILVPYHSQYHYTIDTTLSPWSISQVCQHWRKTAVSTPRLWCHIGINMTKPAIRQRDTVYLVKLALERAQDHLLTIRYHDDRRFRMLSEAIQHVLVTRSHLWKSLDFKSGDLTGLAEAKGRLDRLETLYLADDPEMPSDIFFEPATSRTTTFAVAPQLREAKIHDHSMIELPWNQLELFEASEGRPLADLHRCPRLTLYTGPHLPPRGDIPVFSGNLRHTCLTHLSVFSFEDTLRLELPSLSMLKIYFATPGVFLGCADLVRRSRCRLNIFGLGMLAEVEEKSDVIEFLRVCSHITEMHLMWINIEPAMLDSILGPLVLLARDVREDPNRPEFTPPLVPNLSALNLDFRRTNANSDLFHDFDQSRLVALFESRYYLDPELYHGTESVNELDAVIICTQASARSYEVPEFRALTEAGLCLLILEMDESGRPVHDLRKFYLDPDPELEVDNYEDDDEDEETEAAG